MVLMLSARVPTFVTYSLLKKTPRSPIRFKSKSASGNAGDRGRLGSMMQRLIALLPSLRVSVAAGLACVISFAAGYLLAGWWSDAHDTTPLEQICDHVNSLEEEFPEQQLPNAWRDVPRRSER
jgi:hypothetical protein